MDQDNAIRELLRTSRVIAVVGLSADEGKPSNVVARYLMDKGYKIIPVNPGQETILGQKSYKSLADIDEKVDIVDIFMKAEKVLPFVRDAMACVLRRYGCSSASSTRRQRPRRRRQDHVRHG